MPYGYTCAAKIEGGKDARKYKLVEVVIAKEFERGGYRYAVRVDIVGTNDFLRKPCDNTGKIVGVYEIENKLFAEIKR
jgi:hypothetical protein